MRVIGVNGVMSELQKILSSLDIKSLYIFLDDFSELPREAMHLLVDALISPLARWSDFIKFKIAAYPGRVYLGSLDKTKIEEIQLDMYGLYGASGVAKMEEKATDFVRRLVEKRIQYFCKVDPGTFFNLNLSDIWRTLFYASMANPRILGHIMLYAYDSQLIYEKRIGIQAIQESAQRYFEEKIAPFFATGKYRLALEERSSIYSLKELLETIVSRARAIRQEGSRDRLTGRSRPYASHFYVSHEYDELLQSLETSFFITKYFEQSDREGVRVSIYALNFGLCVKYQISFGRPSDRREDRLYFVDRKFDYNALARSYIQENQEIRCSHCGVDYDLSMLPALKLLHMNCPTCKYGDCKVVNLSKKYGDVIESIGPELLLPETELGIMQTLYNEKKPMVAAEIAGDLDCSGQLVGRRGKNLAERKLVDRTSSGQVFRYELTDQAKSAYFSDSSTVELDITEDGG
jgi:DNA-binding MarR family transcriptional regulator